MSKHLDALGDRMKMYENACCGDKAMPLLPVCARIDGRCFHNFTKDLQRPFDENFHKAMLYTTIRLVEETSAKVGYIQSDEISLVFWSPDRSSQIFFDGKIKKMTSMLAAMATLYFQKGLQAHLPHKLDSAALFDCRVWQVPNLEEASNVLVWRELDATKNSISMAASAHFSHNELMGKNSSDKQEMLFQKGINWNDYPDSFKRGVYVRRKLVETTYTTKELERLPEKHAARANPNLKIQRHVVVAETLPRVLSISNRIDCLFLSADPILKTQE